MEKFFELQYNLQIIALIGLGVAIVLLGIIYGIHGLVYFYKSHSKRYEYSRGKYVKKEKDRHDRT